MINKQKRINFVNMDKKWYEKSNQFQSNQIFNGNKKNMSQLRRNVIIYKSFEKIDKSLNMRLNLRQAVQKQKVVVQTNNQQIYNKQQWNKQIKREELSIRIRFKGQKDEIKSDQDMITFLTLKLIQISKSIKSIKKQLLRQLVIKGSSDTLLRLIRQQFVVTQYELEIQRLYGYQLINTQQTQDLNLQQNGLEKGKNLINASDSIQRCSYWELQQFLHQTDNAYNAVRRQLQQRQDRKMKIKSQLLLREKQVLHFKEILTKYQQSLLFSQNQAEKIGFNDQIIKTKNQIINQENKIKRFKQKLHKLQYQQVFSSKNNRSKKIKKDHYTKLIRKYDHQQLMYDRSDEEQIVSYNH